MYKISTIFQLQDSFGDFLKTVIAPEPDMEQRKFGLQLPHCATHNPTNRFWKQIVEDDWRRARIAGTWGRSLGLAIVDPFPWSRMDVWSDGRDHPEQSIFIHTYVTFN